jgi:hypothetical protein
MRQPTKLELLEQAWEDSTEGKQGLWEVGYRAGLEYAMGLLRNEQQARKTPKRKGLTAR